jgi:hypothetical protein
MTQHQMYLEQFHCWKDLDDLCISSKLHHTPISDIFINYGGDPFPKYPRDVIKYIKCKVCESVIKTFKLNIGSSERTCEEIGEWGGAL